MNTFNTFQELKSLVDQFGGVMTVTLGELRDAYGVDRLGVHVKAGITKKLDGEGLKAYPPELPTYQHELVRVYKAGSAISELIDAVLNPDEAHDEELRQAVSKSGGDVLQQIRALVCD
jgi:hypothetical protein